MTMTGPLEAQLAGQQEQERARRIINAGDDPEAFTAATSSPPPEPMRTEIKPPPDTTVVLPAGIMTFEGRTLHTVNVRELTGADEEQLAKVLRSSKTDSVMDYVTEILRLGVTPTFDEWAIDNMLIGDRDAVVLGVRLATFGDDYDYGDVECMQCGAKFHVEIDLRKDVPNHVLEGDRFFTHATKNGMAMRFRIATHGDQMALTKVRSASMADQNTVLLARCLLEVDGIEAAMLDTEEIVRGLGMRDRAEVIKKISSLQPGPKTGEVRIQCPECKNEAELPFDLAATFRL